MPFFRNINPGTKVILCVYILSIFVLASSGITANRDSQISPGEIIVKFTEPPNIEKTSAGIRFGNRLVDSLSTQYRVTDATLPFKEFYQTTGEWGDVVVLRMDDDRDPASIADDFQRSSRVVWAQPNHVFRTEYVPNDSFITDQWYLDKIQAFEAWDITTGDPSVLLGVIDTGIQWDHPDLRNVIWVNEAEDLNHNGTLDSLDLNGVDDDGNGFVDDVIGWDFTDALPFPAYGDFLVRDNDPYDEMGHGTAVAGIVVSQGNNLWGTAGVAHGCKLLCLRAGNSEGFLQEDDVAAAILYSLLMGVRAVNMSFGDHLVSPLLREIVQYASEQGLVMVCSAGNHGSDEIHYPSGYDQTICVGATGLNDEWASFSNVGSSLDLVAPGRQIFSTLLGNQWGLFYGSGNGTSFSAPVVTGVVGLILSVNPSLDPEQVRDVLNSTADSLGPSGWDIQYGHGRVNAFRAVQAAELGPTVEARISNPHTDFGFSGGTLPIIGSAAGSGFQSYQLFWGYGITPSNWIQINLPQPYQIVNDTLGILDLPQSPDTTITLRLKVNTDGGSAILDHVRIIYDTSPPIISNRTMTMMIDADHWSALLEFETDDITSGFVDARPQGSQQAFAAYSLGYETNHHRLLFPQPEFSGDFEYYITVTNRAGLVDTSDIFDDLTLTQPPFHRNIFVQHNINLPPGYFLYKPTDFDGDGWPEVVLNKYTNSFFDTLKIYESGPSGFTDINSNYVLVIPQDVGDSDADGKLELMGRAYGTTYVFEATNPGDFPNNLIFRDTSNVYGSNLLDLDSTDGHGEMILRRDDQYTVYRHLGDGELEEIDQLTNQTGGDNRFGKPQVEIADLDGDGMVEALYGDYDGNILIFEHRGNEVFDFVWSDSLPLPDATNWMTTGDFDGDGALEFIAGCWTYGAGTESEFTAKRWIFVIFDVPANDTYIPVDTLVFFGAEHPTDYDEGVSAGDVTGDGSDEILLCLYPDFYIIDYDSVLNDYQPIWYYPRCESNLALVTDFDRDGANEFIFNTGTQVVAYGVDPNRPPAPSGVAALPIDTTAIVISWQAVAGADSYQVDRATGNAGFSAYQHLTPTTFTDAAVMRDTVYHYVIYTMDTAYPTPISPPSLEVTAVPNTRPEALPTADFTPPHFVKIWFDEPMNESVSYTGHYSISGWGSPVTAISFASGTQVLLAFPGAFPRGSYRVEMEGLWDQQGSMLSDSLRHADFLVTTDTTYLPYLTRASIVGRYGISMEFSAPMETDPLIDPTNYHITPVGYIDAADQSSPNSVMLRLSKDTPIGAVGRVFRVSAWNLFDMDGNPIDTLHNSAELTSHNENLDNVYVYPNPYTGVGPDGSEAVMIAGLTREAKVYIMTISGILVRTLTETNGDGGVLWDLRNQHGEGVASGIYLYYITSGPYKKKGKFAVLR
jgi:subtilisin family serine protease